MPGRRTLTATIAFAKLVAYACLVDLSDRGGGDRLAERDVKSLDLGAKRPLDLLDRNGSPKRIHAVLQPLELTNHRRADEIRPGRQELPELDIGRTEPADRRRKRVERRSRLAPADHFGKR